MRVYLFLRRVLYNPDRLKLFMLTFTLNCSFSSSIPNTKILGELEPGVTKLGKQNADPVEVPEGRVTVGYELPHMGAEI